MPKFQEFFAGGGMVRAGLGQSWRCTFSNDIDLRKANIYRENWGEGEIVHDDVANIKVHDLGENVDLSWASFPCQDLSLAGGGAGLNGTRSSAFHNFWDLITGQIGIGKPPSIVVLENVMGAITSHGGSDFSELCSAYWRAGYLFGAISLDANHFLPQSRKRVFFVGVLSEKVSLEGVTGVGPCKEIHPSSIVKAFDRLDVEVQENWVWWNLPELPARKHNLDNFVGSIDDKNASWHSEEKTKYLISLMDTNNIAKLNERISSNVESVGTLYRRMRRNSEGNSVQRAEIRFDGVAGCLRVPLGGSSKQTLVFVSGNRVRSRELSAREAARLMGLKSDFLLPASDSDTYHLAGDGVAVPVVEFLRDNLFDRLLRINKSSKEKKTSKIVGS